MRRSKQIIIWTIIIFLLVTFLTKNTENNDPFTKTYGFPLRFYFEIDSAICHNCDYTSLGYFLADIGLTGLVIYFMILLKSKIGVK